MKLENSKINFWITYSVNLIIRNTLEVKDHLLESEGHFPPQVEYLKKILINNIIFQKTTVINYYESQ